MRTIKLRVNGLGRYDDVSPFIVTDNELLLKIELPNFNGEFYFVAELNGAQIRKRISEDGSVYVGELSAGELFAEVKHYLHGELIKTYKVEPLLLKEVDGTVHAMPEIELLKDEISALKKELAEVKEWHADSVEATEDGFRIVMEMYDEFRAAFLAFAFAEYENDVQLNAHGLSIVELAEALGIDTDGLTDEGLEEIKNRKEKL